MNGKDDKISEKKKSVMILLVVIMVVAIPLGYVTKVIPYVFITMRCGHPPVEVTNFAGNASYTMPGDKGYGISMFSSYDYCTEDEAKQAGYAHSVLAQ